MSLRHLTSIQDLTDGDVAHILREAARYAGDLHGHARDHVDRIVCTAFFEPSTRTRLSFETAAHRLGCSVIGFSDPASTSSAKGETLEDTTRILSGYADLVVMRHPQEGAAARAAAVSLCPIVNAGDGPGEHPTQTLLDLFTMQREKGELGALRVAVVGDLKFGRTVHSLVPMLRRVGAQVVQVPAPGLELPPKASQVEVLSLDEAAATCDVLYITRVQKERFADPQGYEAARGALVVDRALLERNRSRAIVMHPLPRVGEVAPDVDGLPAAKYFDQARNGVPVRMAVLGHLLETAA